MLVGPDKNAKGVAYVSAKLFFCCLWKAVATRRGPWWLKKGECDAHVKKRKQTNKKARSKIRGTAGWAVPGKAVREIHLEVTSRHVKEKMVTTNIQSGFTKGKQYLKSLIVLYDEKFSSGTKRKTVNVVSLDISKTLAYDLFSHSILADIYGDMEWDRNCKNGKKWAEPQGLKGSDQQFKIYLMTGYEWCSSRDAAV